MSVVGLARDRDFVAQLRRIQPAYRIRPSLRLVVESRCENRGGIGLAFDYLYRVVLAKRLHFEYPHLRWAADHACVRLSPSDDSITFRDEYRPGELVTLSSSRSGLGLNRVLFAHRTLIDAKVAVAEYHSTGDLTDALIWSLYKVGQLEMVVRSGKPSWLDPEKLLTPNPVAVDELRALIELAEHRALTPTQILHLDPSLSAAHLVGGASPDLIVDGWVCELKTVASWGDATRWADQLSLYVALCSLGGLDLWETDSWKAPPSILSSQAQELAKLLGDKQGQWSSSTDREDSLPDIAGVAVYFARHGEWVVVPLASMMTSAQLERVKNLLCRSALRSDDPEQLAQFRQSLLPDWARARKKRPRK